MNKILIKTVTRLTHTINLLPQKWRQLVWFIVLWCFGLMSVFLLSLPLKGLVHFMKAATLSAS